MKDRTIVKWLFCTNGAASIFMVMIIVPIFLLIGILIDYSRIKLAGQQTELAVKAGVRSALSAFDSEIRTYGLFGQGLGEEKSRQLFTEVMRKNFSSSAADSARFRYADPSFDPERAQIEHVYTLADQVVLKRQILEEMKYKAPIEFALNIADKFKKTEVAGNLSDASRYAGISEKVENVLEKRDDRLRKAWDKIGALKQLMEEQNGWYGEKLRRLNELAGLIGTATRESVMRALGEITVQMEEGYAALSGLQQERNRLNQAIAAMTMAGADGMALAPLFARHKALSDEIASLEVQLENLTAAKHELDMLLQRIMEYIAIVSEIKANIAEDDALVSEMEEEILAHLAEARKWNSQLFERQEDGTVPFTGGKDAAGQVFRNLAISDEEMGDYLAKAGSAASAFHGFRQQLENAELFLGPPYERLLEANDRYLDIMSQFYSRYVAVQQMRESRQSEAERHKREKRKDIQTVLDKVREEVIGCPADRTASLQAAYSRLQGQGESGLYMKYMAYNDNAQWVNLQPELPDAKEAAKHTFQLVDRLVSVLEDVRDELYINEFALSKFTYRTQEKAAAKGADPSVFPDPSGRVLYLQEAEYILYGFSSCEANYSAAYIEMFTLRLAIRTLEHLLEPQTKWLNLGSPMLVVLAAMAEGAAKAYDDMAKLLDGEDVPLFDKLDGKIRMNYKDYLRLFYFLHSSDKPMMSRIQALIELNTGKDLTGLTTYVQGTGTASIRLWFIPSAMKGLDLIGVLGCKVRQNHCEWTSVAVFSY